MSEGHVNNLLKLNLCDETDYLEGLCLLHQQISSRITKTKALPQKVSSLVEGPRAMMDNV